MIQDNHILPGDSRYNAVIDRRFNKHFVGRPEYVVVATSPQDVIVAVRDAVRDGKRIVATSGGHCLEGFVSDPDVQVVVDVSPMKLIEYD
ncbi:MAG: FAD-binding protein, partial [Gemmatimonadota bacterium]|nr:FAD-binding protein [Gemmatimonadota bacterium]